MHKKLNTNKQNKPSFTLGLFCFEDSFIGIVDGKPMKFVYEEYLEYIPFYY